MLLHRVSPCAQEEAIPEEVPPQVEGMEEEEEEAVQEASEAKVRGAEERQLVSTVENAGAATPLAAAATPFAAAAPAAHNGKAPLRPKSLAAISDQPAAHLEEVEEAALDESSVAALPSVHVAVAAADQVPADGPAAPLASPPADAAAAELTVGASASVRDEDRPAPLQLAERVRDLEEALSATRQSLSSSDEQASAWRDVLDTAQTRMAANADDAAQSRVAASVERTALTMGDEAATNFHTFGKSQRPHSALPLVSLCRFLLRAESTPCLLGADGNCRDQDVAELLEMIYSMTAQGCTPDGLDAAEQAQVTLHGGRRLASSAT